MKTVQLCQKLEFDSEVTKVSKIWTNLIILERCKKVQYRDVYH